MTKEQRVLEFTHGVLHQKRTKPTLSYEAYHGQRPPRAVAGGAVWEKHKLVKSFTAEYSMHVEKQPNAGYKVMKHYNQLRNFITHKAKWSDNAKKMIKLRAEYAEYVLKPLSEYNYNVSEPAIAIIDKMLTRPERFITLKVAVDNLRWNPRSNRGKPGRQNVTTIQDRDTGVKFCTDCVHSERRVFLPSCFTPEESTVIGQAVADVVYATAHNEFKRREKLAKAKLNKHRAELSAKYA